MFGELVVGKNRNLINKNEGIFSTGDKVISAWRYNHICHSIDVVVVVAGDLLGVKTGESYDASILKGEEEVAFLFFYSDLNHAGNFHVNLQSFNGIIFQVLFDGV